MLIAVKISAPSCTSLWQLREQRGHALVAASRLASAKKIRRSPPPGHAGRGIVLNAQQARVLTSEVCGELQRLSIGGGLWDDVGGLDCYSKCNPAKPPFTPHPPIKHFSGQRRRSADRHWTGNLCLSKLLPWSRTRRPEADIKAKCCISPSRRTRFTKSGVPRPASPRVKISKALLPSRGHRVGSFCS